MNNSPCLGCLERKLGCHQNCEDYINFDKERKEFNKAKSEYLSSNKWTDSKIKKSNNLLKECH